MSKPLNGQLSEADQYATLVGLVATRTALQHILRMREGVSVSYLDWDLVLGVLATGAAALEAAGQGDGPVPDDNQLAILERLTNQLLKMEAE